MTNTTPGVDPVDSENSVDASSAPDTTAEQVADGASAGAAGEGTSGAANDDAPAGEEPTSTRPEQSMEDLAKASDVEEYMRDVIDPELGINVVDLGLVYDIWIENGDEAVIEMTLTSPACPLTEMLEEQAEAAVVGSGCCSSLDLRWVWMPPWGPHMITEDGREQLRALGFSV